MNEQPEDAESVPQPTATPRSSGSGEKEIDSRQAANDFHPIKIKGEPLSETILRERR